MTLSRRKGEAGEQQARAYLENCGLIWIHSNYRCHRGEIDLIMREHETLVFVEVRYRSYSDYGDSIESIVGCKQQRLIKAAFSYLIETKQIDRIDSRFDIIGLAPGEEIYWIQNAFEVKY